MGSFYERLPDDVTWPGGREPRNEINSGRKHRVNNVKRRFNVSPLESSSAKFHRETFALDSY